jgi:hypothetical protein
METTADTHWLSLTASPIRSPSSSPISSATSTRSSTSTSWPLRIKAGLVFVDIDFIGQDSQGQPSTRNAAS